MCNDGVYQHSVTGEILVVHGEMKLMYPDSESFINGVGKRADIPHTCDQFIEFDILEQARIFYTMNAKAVQ